MFNSIYLFILFYLFIIFLGVGGGGGGVLMQTCNKAV